MKNAGIRCGNFICQELNKNGECTIDGPQGQPCVMDCSYHSDCTVCKANCKEIVTEDGFIIK